MRVGLDLDGLLDERPEFFRFLTTALRGGGHYVAVLTYRGLYLPKERMRSRRPQLPCSGLRGKRAR